MINVPLSEIYIALSDIIICFLCLFFIIESKQIISKKLFASVFISSLFGAIYHLYFPDRLETFAGNLVWLFVCIGILLTTWFLIQISFNLLKLEKAKWVEYVFILCSILSLYMTFMVNGKFYNLLFLYMPIVISLMIISAIKKKCLLTFACIFSVLAGVVQYTKISIDPTIFTYNTIYHLIQALSLYLFYRYLTSQYSDNSHFY